MWFWDEDGLDVNGFGMNVDECGVGMKLVLDELAFYPLPVSCGDVRGPVATVTNPAARFHEHRTLMLLPSWDWSLAGIPPLGVGTVTPAA